jgi:hypothetical protein
MIRESAGTSDRQEAERFLRDRLDARDEGRLTVVLKSKQLTFNEWADWFLERRSKPPFRSNGNHQQNLNALKFLRPVFGDTALSDITTEAIENYLADRLASGRRVHTKSGVELRGKIKPATAHQEFRILSHMLNVAVKLKRLSANPCVAVEFPVSVAKSTGDDARGASEAGSQGQRAANFEHREGELNDFMHIYWHTRRRQTEW